MVGLLVNNSDLDDTEDIIINDYQELIAELNLFSDLPAKPELLGSSKNFNRKTQECRFINGIQNKNSDEGKIVELSEALKFKLHVPLYCQLFGNKE